MIACLLPVVAAGGREYDGAMKALGRFLQFAGLLALPLSMFLELTGTLGRFYVSNMVTMMVFGVAAFYLGRLLEGYGSG